MCILQHLCWKFSAMTNWERVLVVQTSLRQEKSVLHLPWSKIEWTKTYHKSCDLSKNKSFSCTRVVQRPKTIILGRIALEFHIFEIKEAFISSWVLSKRGMCKEVSSILWRLQSVCLELEASYLGSSELVDRNNQTCRTFYTLGSFVSVT